MLCSKHHCQKGFNLNPFSYKIRADKKKGPTHQEGKVPSIGVGLPEAILV